MAVSAGRGVLQVDAFSLAIQLADGPVQTARRLPKRGFALKYVLPTILPELGLAPCWFGRLPAKWRRATLGGFRDLDACTP